MINTRFCGSRFARWTDQSVCQANNQSEFFSFEWFVDVYTPQIPEQQMIWFSEVGAYRNHTQIVFASLLQYSHFGLVSSHFGETTN